MRTGHGRGTDGKLGFGVHICVTYQMVGCSIYPYPFDMRKADDGNLFPSALHSIALDDLAVLQDGSADSLLLGDDQAKNSTDAWR